MLVLGAAAAARADDTTEQAPPRYARGLLGLGSASDDRIAMRSGVDVLPARIGDTLLGARVGFGGNVSMLSGPDDSFFAVGPRVALTDSGAIAPVLSAGVSLAFVEHSYSTFCIDFGGSGCPEDPPSRSEVGAMADVGLGVAFRLGPFAIGPEIGVDLGTVGAGFAAELTLGWTESS
jgi:hypothetical protein